MIQLTPAEELRRLLAAEHGPGYGILYQVAREVLTDRDRLADELAKAGPGSPLEEVWLVDDEDHADPGVYTTEEGARQRALEDAAEDWRIPMGDSPVTFTWYAFGDKDDPSYEVMLHSPAIGKDSTGITVRHLNINRPHDEPEDVWAPGSTAYGYGEKSPNGNVFIGPQMSEDEARRRINEMAILFPETAGQYQLLRWRIGPATAVRDEARPA